MLKKSLKSAMMFDCIRVFTIEYRSQNDKICKEQDAMKRDIMLAIALAIFKYVNVVALSTLNVPTKMSELPKDKVKILIRFDVIYVRSLWE